MHIPRIARFVCLAFCLWLPSVSATAEDFTNAIRAFLEHRGEVEKTDGAIVVGLLDEHGSTVICYGKLDNGTDRPVDGDSVFNIYSASCRFTALLLADMVARGQMKPADPVAIYLPPAVKVPSYHGQPITLRHLVTETSGFPYSTEIENHFEPKRADNPGSDFDAQALYACVNNYQLTRAPGSVHLHGSVDMGLLGLAMSLKAGTNYEALLADRICRPLGMNSTGGSLTLELKSRFAAAHPDRLGFPAPPWDSGALTPLCGLSSTANDLLKFLSADLGFTPSHLPELTKECLADFPAKLKVYREQGINEAGGGNNHVSPYFVADRLRHRGVVVLSSSGNGDYNSRAIGKWLLESEWRSDRRPAATPFSGGNYGSLAGQYQRAPDFALGLFCLEQDLRGASKKVVFPAAGLSLALLIFVAWLMRGFRKRRLLLCVVGLVVVVLASLTPLALSHAFCARFQPRIGIRSDGGRLFAHASAIGLWPAYDWDHADSKAPPIDELLPPLPFELLPQSANSFFERLSGMPVTFSYDQQGEAIALYLTRHGRTFRYEKITSQPPPLPDPPRRPIAVKLDSKSLEACVGRYEEVPGGAFPAGATITIWREGNQLMSRKSGNGTLKGEIEIYPESETNFFDQMGGVLTFKKNGQGHVTAAIFHFEQWPDVVAVKTPAP